MHVSFLCNHVRPFPGLNKDVPGFQQQQQRQASIRPSVLAHLRSVHEAACTVLNNRNNALDAPRAVLSPAVSPTLKRGGCWCSARGPGMSYRDESGSHDGHLLSPAQRQPCQHLEIPASRLRGTFHVVSNDMLESTRSSDVAPKSRVDHLTTARVAFSGNFSS
jgi:hypothetical protein